MKKASIFFHKEMKIYLQITYVRGSLFGMNQIYERKESYILILAVDDRLKVFLSATLFVTQYNVYIERLSVILNYSVITE